MRGRSLDSAFQAKKFWLADDSELSPSWEGWCNDFLAVLTTMLVFLAKATLWFSRRRAA
jgi:hypothetical protein